MTFPSGLVLVLPLGLVLLIFGGILSNRISDSRKMNEIRKLESEKTVKWDIYLNRI